MNELCVEVVKQWPEKTTKSIRKQKKIKMAEYWKGEKKRQYIACVCVFVCEQCEIKLIMMIEQEIYQFDFHSLCIIFYDETISGFFNFPI